VEQFEASGDHHLFSMANLAYRLVLVVSVSFIFILTGSTANQFLPYPSEDGPRSASLLVHDMRCEGIDRSPWCPDSPINLQTFLGRSEITKPVGVLNMIVLLVRFADHESKPLPPSNDYKTVFNTDHYVQSIAPTGSLKMFYQAVSQGKLSIQSTVEEWITIDETEEAMSFGHYGLSNGYGNTAKLALKQMDERGVDWNLYDKNGDGLLDAVFIVHSGYSAEVGGTDCYTKKEWGAHRIWSHQGVAAEDSFVSANGAVRLSSFATASGLINSCGAQICRIGSICHEMGHLLGVPDLSGSAGAGIGTWDIMGQLWGADQSQYLPSMFGAYSRQLLGWVQPQILSKSGWYQIRASAINGDFYRIDAGFPNGEYLLIENRQAVSYDQKFPSTGLMIWHIDENVDGGWQSRPGWPGQEGWPYNGYHYHVSILQADGLYELEKGVNGGGPGDLFAGRDARLVPGGPYPNSDGYSGGFVFQSGVTISNISKSSEYMYFWADIPSTDPARPAPVPTPPPSLWPTSSSLPSPIRQSRPRPLTPARLPLATPMQRAVQFPTQAPSPSPSSRPSGQPSLRMRRFPTKDPSPVPSERPSFWPTTDVPSGTVSVAPLRSGSVKWTASIREKLVNGRGSTLRDRSDRSESALSTLSQAFGG
jgi:M6 family metalloprotease-like protein